MVDNLEERRKKDRNRYQEIYKKDPLHRKKINESSLRYYYKNRSNPEFMRKRNEKSKLWASKNKSKLRGIWRGGNLRKKYGIDVGDYDRLLDSQGGVCAICGDCETLVHKQGETPQKLAVDHNHVTGKIRGFFAANVIWHWDFFRGTVGME